MHPTPDPHPHTNRLATETSPYLLKHAHNPVDWYPWGAEALTRARTLDRPILLSIGYSACHWCHVMEHESFENETIAAIMNRLFVCIKVDREERPDLDRIYQTAHQLLVRRPGGWPLTMFLSPDDQTPFFGGTYFPSAPRYGLPGFGDLLEKIAGYYRTQRAGLEAQNASVREALNRVDQAPDAMSGKIGPAPLAEEQRVLREQFDPVHGGFGSAPKFPHASTLARCLRYYEADPQGEAGTDALHMAAKTLTTMARGGIFDQLGGGFYRYSVDERWEIPHFEKMLYDNGPLLELYADLASITGDVLPRQAALMTAAWVMREMQSPEGGYYATLDADSEGHEGRFYVFDRDQFRAAVPAADLAAAERHFGLDLPANFEHQWHLRVARTTVEVAAGLGLDPETVSASLARARASLLRAREARPRPARDEKMLTSWNALMIKGMAHAGRILQQPELVESAQRAFDFVRTHLWVDQRLLAVTKDGRTRLNAYLDDYAFLLDAGLELLAARWRDGDLAFLIGLADALLDHFEDHAHGGFYFTSEDHEQLLYRPKPGGDDATPSGNGVAASALLRLGHLLGRVDFLSAAERTIEAFYEPMTRYPSGHSSLINALQDLLTPPEILLLRGPAAGVAPLLARAQRYQPQRLTLALPNEAADLHGALAALATAPVPTAYLCQGHQCGAPVVEPGAIDALLGIV